MKKLITVLLLFMFSLFITRAQSKMTYGMDSLKSVTVNVMPAIQTMPAVLKTQAKSTATNSQQQLTKALDNQSTVNLALANGISSLAQNITKFTKEVEEQNKSSDSFITDKFGYSTEKVKHTIKIERWLNFITWLLITMYILYTFHMKGTLKLKSKDSTADWSFIPAQLMMWLFIYVFTFLFIKNTLTLLFNGDFYVIKELINMYT